MADKIGILGESVATAVGSVTVYTVPSSKAARVRVLFVFRNNTGATRDIVIRVGPASAENIIGQQITADGDELYSGVAPTSGVAKTIDMGIREENSAGSVSATTGERNLHYLPLDRDFFLSTGDVVNFQISTNAVAETWFQVQGVETDA